MARLKSFRAAASLMSERLTGEPRRLELVRFAREVIGEAEAKNRAALGGDVSYETIVDGRAGAPIESVKAHGVVVALFDVTNPVVDFAWKTIAGLSPILTGRYRNSHRLLINGAEVDPPEPGRPIKVQPDDEVTFVNLLPYARKIEAGWSGQAPDGVYEAATTIVRARYGNLVTVRFSYREFAGYSTLRRDPSTMSEGTRAIRYPVLTLSPRGARR
jgi:hypothetical protein